MYIKSIAYGARLKYRQFILQFFRIVCTQFKEIVKNVVKLSTTLYKTKQNLTFTKIILGLNILLYVHCTTIAFSPLFSLLYINKKEKKYFCYIIYIFFNVTK